MWGTSVDEQMLLLAIGDELDTAFLLLDIFSDDNSAPSSLADAFHVTFPDGAVKASIRITLDTTGTLEVHKGRKMTGNIKHTGGALFSNGVQVDDHAHGNVQSGGSWTKGTQ